ncbi:alpha/beta hydrolase [Candidatus Micrarchaeota archaeon]|nr:alpha/beta hydrolase [Candidatus Micrarchaeota archaeon]
MTNIFIIHGTGGHPGENWFPWLKQELENLGCKVIVPQFPTPQNQTPETWFEVFDKHKKDFNSDTLLVAHSLGGAFALRILERSPIKINAAFFVGTPIGVRPIKNWDGDQPFIGKPFNWTKIKSNCENMHVFHSDDDPFVGIGNGIELAKNLNADFTHLPSAGHFNAKAGYTKFDLLLEKIKSLLFK